MRPSFQLWGNRKGQPPRSAMQKPHPGPPLYVIGGRSAPGKYGQTVQKHLSKKKLYNVLHLDNFVVPFFQLCFVRNSINFLRLLLFKKTPIFLAHSPSLKNRFLFDVYSSPSSLTKTRTKLWPYLVQLPNMDMFES